MNFLTVCHFNCNNLSTINCNATLNGKKKEQLEIKLAKCPMFVADQNCLVLVRTFRQTLIKEAETSDLVTSSKALFTEEDLF